MLRGHEVDKKKEDKRRRKPEYAWLEHQKQISLIWQTDRHVDNLNGKNDKLWLFHCLSTIDMKVGLINANLTIYWFYKTLLTFKIKS